MVPAMDCFSGKSGFEFRAQPSTLMVLISMAMGAARIMDSPTQRKVPPMRENVHHD